MNIELFSALMFSAGYFSGALSVILAAYFFGNNEENENDDHSDHCCS